MTKAEKGQQLRNRKVPGCGCDECKELESLAKGLERGDLTLIPHESGHPYEEIVGTPIPPKDVQNTLERNTEPVCAGLDYWLAPPVKQIQNVLRSLPSQAEDRKLHPILSGCVDYFPLALAAIARISKAGNDQHNPGQPLHWARGKSTDHGDCILRHLIERGTIDTDGMRHSAKMAWRALALLQEELEAEQGWTPNQ